MSSHAAAVAASAAPWRSGGGSTARHMPRRGQIKARIASAAVHSVASALLKAIHGTHILVRNPF
ncbi:hypothetical protein HU200_001840 [Digitaria exilis]|uniref:Uncharacterized protein n=1 Tax=Digitaria exilis TaxID=1010633 RepID=A0A835KVM5_9POAL|nr:hypothetical protein HU200_001840 [Digitaria exilis]